MTAARSLQNSREIEIVRAGAPAEMRAEIVGGSVLMSPAPRSAHQFAIAELYVQLRSKRVARRARGSDNNADAWLVLVGPEVHLGLGPDKLVPDIAGWRGEGAPSLDEYPIVRAPEWVCEVLSPSTEVHDRATKLPLYAGYGTRHAWLIDPERRALEVFALSEGDARQVACFEGDAVVRAAPFDAIELDLSSLWG